MTTLRPLDWVSARDHPDVTPCPTCGSPVWIVDGDGPWGQRPDRWWLLCAALGRSQDCVECRELPPGVVVAELSAQ